MGGHFFATLQVRAERRARPRPCAAIRQLDSLEVATSRYLEKFRDGLIPIEGLSEPILK